MTEWEDDVTIFGIVTIGIVTIVTKSCKKSSQQGKHTGLVSYSGWHLVR